jgi:hypothetical protein
MPSGFVLYRVCGYHFAILQLPVTGCPNEPTKMTNRNLLLPKGSLVSSANSQLLVNALESQAELDGRYIGLKCVNINSLTGEKRGCFSLVFRAFDKVDQRPVALKFFDLDSSNIFAQLSV